MDKDEDVKKEDVKKGEDDEVKKFKFGIVYLSYIPDGMNVKILRDIIGQYGEVGRIYLEPEENNRKKYVEGWVEFKKKRVAKEVAKTLNGTPLNHGKKRSRMNGQIWSVKYLHKFKWAHLTEQLAHDKATRDQKRSFELSQTKKQVDFYQKMTERSKMLRRRHRKGDDINEEEEAKAKTLKLRQNRPIGQGNELEVSVDADLLANIFKKVS